MRAAEVRKQETPHGRWEHDVCHDEATYKFLISTPHPLTSPHPRLESRDNDNDYHRPRMTNPLLPNGRDKKKTGNSKWAGKQVVLFCSVLALLLLT